MGNVLHCVCGFRCFHHLFGHHSDQGCNSLGFQMMSAILFLMDFFGFSHPDKELKGMNFKKGDHVLDIGCGTGRHILPVLKRIGHEGRIIAVDVHPLAIQKTSKLVATNQKKNAVQVKLMPNAYCLFNKEDANEIIHKTPFDVMYCVNVLHHIKQKEKFLDEAARYCAKGGVLYIRENFVRDDNKNGSGGKNIKNCLQHKQKSWKLVKISENETLYTLQKE